MKQIISSIAVVALVLAPAVVSAQNVRSLRPTPATTERPQQDRGASLCSQLDTLESTLMSVVSTQKNNRAASRQGRRDQAQTRQQQHVGKVQENRETRRAERYTRLEERAQTDN